MLVQSRVSALGEYEYSYNHFLSSPLDSLKNEAGEVLRAKENIAPPDGFATVNEILYAADDEEEEQEEEDDDDHGHHRHHHHHQTHAYHQKQHHKHKQPNHPQKQVHKFLYTVRHGKAHHNALSSEYSKPISWRFLGRLRNTFDPRLTAEGVRDAQQIGAILRDLIVVDSAPQPTTVYTSPLCRCIQTAMYAIAELRNGLVLQTTATHHHHHNQQQQQPHHQRITLHVKEGLREWKGYDHNHQSDRRDTTPNIIKLFHDLRAKLSLEAFVQLRIDAGAHDRVDAGPMRETYVDVDRRVRRVLDDIFDDGSGNDDEDDRDHDHCQHCQHCQKHGDQEDATRIVNGHDIHQPSPSPRPRSTGTPACAILVLHNRSNKSILRVMGHTPTEAHRLDFENCAALSYLVRRKRLTPTAVLARAMAEEYQWVQDRQVAEREKADRHRIAGEEIQGYRRTRDAKLWRLRDYLRFWAEGADGACEADPEAAKALVDLYALAPELKE